MKKEEFPTFLNEQPTVIFGRSTRELLIIVCGIVAGYVLWGSIKDLLPGDAWWAVSIVLAVIPAILGLIVALVNIGSRSLEEWFFVWLFYIGMPRLYLYQPLQDDDEIARKIQEQRVKQSESSLLDEEDQEH